MNPTFFPTPEDFRAWLAANHDRETELLVGFYKKGTGKPSITWPESVDEALCYGWIDGVRRTLDEDAYTIRFTPRKAKSIWSKINTDKADALIQAGRMHPAGLREVERAREDGRWERAYSSASVLMVPEDFQRALDADSTAKAFFDTLNAQNRFAILFRIQNVKKAETRARKIAQFVEMLARGEKLYP